MNDNDTLPGWEDMDDDMPSRCGRGCSGCGGGCGGGDEDEGVLVFTHPPKDVTVDYLTLDLGTCGRCIGVKALLDDIVREITPVLEMTGINLTYRTVHIEDRAMAIRYRLRTSPTIRVNGADIEDRVTETCCSDCGEICGEAMDCRSWEIDGTTYEVPPRPVLTNRILERIFGMEPGTDVLTDYTMPENLERFFEGKENHAANP